MHYQVRFVSDDSLPAEIEWAFVRTSSDAYLFIKETARVPALGSCTVFARAWEAWQRSLEVEQVARA